MKFLKKLLSHASDILSKGVILEDKVHKQSQVLQQAGSILKILIGTGVLAANDHAVAVDTLASIEEHTGPIETA